MARILMVAPGEGLLKALRASPLLEGDSIDVAAGDSDAIRRLRGRAFDVLITAPDTDLDEDTAILDEVRAVRPGVRIVILAPPTTPEQVIAALRQRVFACFSAPSTPPRSPTWWPAPSRPTFPGYFSREKVDPLTLRYSMGQAATGVFDQRAEQICRSIRHDCFRYEQPCTDCENRGNELALQFLQDLPAIRKVLSTDARATYDVDPAARSYDEIIFSYPGIYAIAVYRVAHRLFELGVPLLPRIMTEHAHSVTGIDIHPGAEIDESFAIDHGTGVVIGETTRIGKNVRIYQGVTLGALSLPKNAGEQYRGRKRHPAIEDDVIIYSGATILGGDTVIGARSVIGGNVWITASVPPDTMVVMETPRLIYKTSCRSARLSMRARYCGSHCLRQGNRPGPIKHS